MIGDQSDRFSPERLEIPAFENIEAGQNLSVSINFPVNSSAGQSFVVAGDRYSLRIDAQRRCGDGGYAAAQRSDGRPAARMYAVGQQYHVGLAEWIDPDGSACETGMAVGADREQLAAIRGEWGVDIPAEAAQDRLIGRRLRGGEFLYRQRAEDMDALPGPFSQHHVAEPGQVAGRGE